MFATLSFVVQFLDIKQFLPMVLTVSSLKSGNKESKTAGQLTVSKFHV